MRLDWRDAIATVFVVIGLTLALSVTQGWNWPLLGGVREGIVALVVLGLVAHFLGAPRERFYYTDAFGLLTVVIAVAAMAVAIVGGLLTGSAEYLLALMLIVGVMWTIATLRHAVEGHATTPRPTAV